MTMNPLSDKQRELLQAILDGKELEVMGQSQDSMDFRAPGGQWVPLCITDAGLLVRLVTNYSDDYRVKPSVPRVRSQQYHDWHGVVRTWRSDEMSRVLVNKAIWFRSWIGDQVEQP
jgi:hypothetical protein